MTIAALILKAKELSLNMLIEFGDAFDYTGADFRAWCSEAGFTRFEIIRLAGPHQRGDWVQVLTTRRPLVDRLQPAGG